ncbi:MAG: hypothetical protein WBZ36_21030, partial [Candidatus Nitrosopolaris sp.]
MVCTRLRMCKRRLLTQAQEKTNKDDIVITSKEVNKNKFAIDLETECTRCHDITLCSDFDKLCYTCEEC